MLATRRTKGNSLFLFALLHFVIFSDFTQFNHLVDHLAGLKKEVACRIPFKKVAKLVSAPKEFEMNIEEYHDVSAGL